MFTSRSDLLTALTYLVSRSISTNQNHLGQCRISGRSASIWIPSRSVSGLLTGLVWELRCLFCHYTPVVFVVILRLRRLAEVSCLFVVWVDGGICSLSVCFLGMPHLVENQVTGGELVVKSLGDLVFGKTAETLLLGMLRYLCRRLTRRGLGSLAERLSLALAGLGWRGLSSAEGVGFRFLLPTFFFLASAVGWLFAGLRKVSSTFTVVLAQIWYPVMHSGELLGQDPWLAGCLFLMFTLRRSKVEWCTNGEKMNVIYSRASHVAVTSKCCWSRVVCETWTGTFGTLAVSAEPDQTLQNAASDQGLHCLLKLQEVMGLLKFRTIFPSCAKTIDPPVLSVLWCI